MHLLSWGSLRGALAVIMVLLIPDDATVPGWDYEFSVKDFITAITVGCIYFTLLFKATTIGKVMNKLGIDALTDYEEIGYYKSKALIYDEVLQTLDALLKEEKISAQQYQNLRENYHKLHVKFSTDYKDKFANSSELTENLLRLFILGMEKGELKEMFGRREIDEKIYKKILNMLNIQMERIEQGHSQLSTLNERFPVDGFEKFISGMRRLLFLPPQDLQPQELYIYYRTQQQLLETVIRRLEGLENTSLIEVFDNKEALQQTTQLYTALAKNTKQKLDAMLASNFDLLHHFNAIAARNTLDAQQLETLDTLSENEIITDKLYIMLHKELQKD